MSGRQAPDHPRKLLHLGGAAGVHILAHAGLAVRPEAGDGPRQPSDIVVGGQRHPFGVGQPDHLLHGREHQGPLGVVLGQAAVGHPKGGGGLVQPHIDHQLVPLLVKDVGARFVFDATGGEVLGHRSHPRGDAAVPLAELDLARRLKDQVPPGPVGVHPDGHAPQNMAGIGRVQPFFAGDAVQHAEDDGVRPHKRRDVPDRGVQAGGLDGHQDQVHRLPGLGRAVREAARLPVAEGGLDGIAGGAGLIGHHLHPGHLPPEQDAQRPQADQGAGADGPALLQAVPRPQDHVSLRDALGGKAGVRRQDRCGAAGLIRARQALQLHFAQDRRAFRQFFAAKVGLPDPSDPIQFHPTASPHNILDKGFDAFIIPAPPCPVNVNRSQNPPFS